MWGSSTSWTICGIEQLWRTLGRWAVWPPAPPIPGLPRRFFWRLRQSRLLHRRWSAVRTVNAFSSSSVRWHTISRHSPTSLWTHTQPGWSLRCRPCQSTSWSPSGRRCCWHRICLLGPRWSSSASSLVVRSIPKPPWAGSCGLLSYRRFWSPCTASCRTPPTRWHLLPHRRSDRPLWTDRLCQFFLELWMKIGFPNHLVWLRSLVISSKSLHLF